MSQNNVEINKFAKKLLGNTIFIIPISFEAVQMTHSLYLCKLYRTANKIFT